MSNDKPMAGPSVPNREVEGPQDLVMRMNVATSEDWDQVPLPARQQLGWHEDTEREGVGVELPAVTGKSPQELVHSEELTSASPAASRNLVSSVTYHLEATPPPAEPAGAPGSKGYNNLVRGVPAAEGFDFPGEFTLEQGANVRTFRLPEDESTVLSPEEQAKVDGAGPYAPSPAMTDVATTADTTTFDQTPDVNDPYRNADGTLKNPEEVHEAAPAQPESFGATDLADGTPGKEEISAAEGTPAAAGETASAGDDAGGDVPDGSVNDVLKWVGNDSAKARAALEAEQAKDSPRTTLVSQLNDKV